MRIQYGKRNYSAGLVVQKVDTGKRAELTELKDKKFYHSDNSTLKQLTKKEDKNNDKGANPGR
jgi:hypothetical protein